MYNRSISFRSAPVFTNAYLVKAEEIFYLFIHNGLKQINANTFKSAFGIITASSIEDLVEQINQKKEATDFTGFRPKSGKLFGILEN